jgi:Sap, sulfolipid-1-addressing protein
MLPHDERSRPVLADGVTVDLLPLALATVISPIVFISLFLVLQGARPVVNGTLFVLGLGLAVAVTALFSAFVLNAKVTNGGTVDNGISWFNLVLGLAELGAGLWLLFKGPRTGQATPPKILDRLRNAKRPVIVAVGIAVPTYPAAISAGTALLRSDSSASTRGLAVLVYVALCVLVVALPIIVVALRGDRGIAQIRGLSDWLIQHQSTVGAGVLIVVGTYLILIAF